MGDSVSTTHVYMKEPVAKRESMSFTNAGTVVGASVISSSSGIDSGSRSREDCVSLGCSTPRGSAFSRRTDSGVPSDTLGARLRFAATEAIAESGESKAITSASMCDGVDGCGVPPRRAVGDGNSTVEATTTADGPATRSEVEPQEA